MESWRKFLLKEKTRLDKEIEKGKTAFKTVKGEVSAEEVQEPDLEKLLKHLERYAKPVGEEDHMLHFNARSERPAFHGRDYKTNTPGLYGWGLSEESLNYYRNVGPPVYAAELPFIFLIKFKSGAEQVLDLVDGNENISEEEMAEKAKVLKKMVTKHSKVAIKKAQKDQVEVIASIMDSWIAMAQVYILADAIEGLGEEEKKNARRAANEFEINSPITKPLWVSAVGKAIDHNTDFFDIFKLNRYINRSASDIDKVYQEFLPNLFKKVFKQKEVLNHYKAYMGKYFNFDDFVSRFKNDINKEPHTIGRKVEQVIDNGTIKDDMERLIAKIDDFIKTGRREKELGYGGWAGIRDWEEGGALTQLYQVVLDAEHKLRKYGLDFNAGFYLAKMGFNVRRRIYQKFQRGGGQTGDAQAQERRGKHPDEFMVLNKTGFEIVDIFKNPYFEGSLDKAQKSTEDYVGKGASTKDREDVSSYLSRVIKKLNTNQIKSYYREKVKEYDKPYTKQRMLMRKYLLANKQTPEDIKKEIVLKYGKKDFEKGYDYIGEVIEYYGFAEKNFKKYGISPSLLVDYVNMLLSLPKNNEHLISVMQSKEAVVYMSKEQAAFRSLLNKLSAKYKDKKSIMNAIQGYARGETSTGRLMFERKKFKINILSSKKGKKK
jgi:hypothetical protein